MSNEKSPPTPVVETKKPSHSQATSLNMSTETIIPTPTTSATMSSEEAVPTSTTSPPTSVEQILPLPATANDRRKSAAQAIIDLASRTFENFLLTGTLLFYIMMIVFCAILYILVIVLVSILYLAVCCASEIRVEALDLWNDWMNKFIRNFWQDTENLRPFVTELRWIRRIVVGDGYAGNGSA